MLPTADRTGSPHLPAEATFWTPDPDDLGEDGLGFFRNVWTILGVARDQARAVVRIEETGMDVLDQLAGDAGEFDRIAQAIEGGDATDLTEHQIASLGDLLVEDDFPPLEGLELGVAGLSYAMSAVEMFPAASCRGHPGSSAWTDTPVVFFAANKQRAITLQPLVEQTGCFFEFDHDRPDLLVVRGRSIRHTVALATAILDRADNFSRT